MIGLLDGYLDFVNRWFKCFSILDMLLLLVVFGSGSMVVWRSFAGCFVVSLRVCLLLV